jgi:hypothetical protein
MEDRLEMVVSGRRCKAMPDAPCFTSSTIGWNGFFLESHLVSNFDFELPDHWVLNYMVGLQYLQRGRRLFYEDGRQQEHRIRYGECFVLGPREFRRFRMEGGGSVCMLAIDPVVLQDVTGDASGRNLLGLLRLWNGTDDTRRVSRRFEVNSDQSLARSACVTTL